MATLCWTFIGSAVLCYAYAAYVISYTIALWDLRNSPMGYRTRNAQYSISMI